MNLYYKKIFEKCLLEINKLHCEKCYETIMYNTCWNMDWFDYPKFLH